MSRNSYISRMKAIVSEKGQITIPKAVRDRLGITPGTVLNVESIEGKIVAVKTQTHDGFAKWRGQGIVPAGGSVDEYLNLIRG